MKFNHIGIVVNNIEVSINIYKNMGYSFMEDIYLDNIQNNKLVFLENKVTGEKIELIQPINEESTVANFKDGYHHICYEVENIDEFEKEFKGNKIDIIFANKIKAPAFNNRNIIFAYLKNHTIVEFLEVGESYE